MRQSKILLFSGGVVLALPILLVACAYQGAVTATPVGVAAAALPTGKCPTPTFSPIPPPPPTPNPAEPMTPGAAETALARYHTTYPIDNYKPSQNP